VLDNLKEVEPTLFFGVPRIWEKMHAGIAGKLKDAKGAKKKLVELARKAGARASQRRATGREASLVEALEYAAFDKLVFTKLKKAIGLGAARVCVSGAAPIGKDVLEFFASLDLLVLEVYGQSEDTGPTSFNRPGRTRLGTVGPVVPGVEVKFGDDGEILVRGPNVFMGYYKEPEATAAALVDGWLCSGDLGALDDGGFLKITGRKKEIIITAGGKNITPKNIEEAIKQEPLVGEAVVIGDRRKFLSVLVTLEPEHAAKVAAEAGVAVAALHESEVARRVVQGAIDRANADLAQVEKVKKFTILPQPFSIEGGELTPTLKVKRKVVSEKYAAPIDAMYAGDRDA
jgi:long-chain acyl-CoA synthetase